MLLGIGLELGANCLRSAVSNAATVSLTMQMDWKFNVQFAGLLLADYQHFYADSGLEVTLRPWESGMVVPNEVVANPTILGCAEQNLILSAQAEGAPIRAIATLFQSSPLGLMVLPDSNIRSLQDLVGQKVGMHVDGLKVMALVAGVSHLAPDAIEVVPIPYEDKYARLLSGELAAVQCYAIDEPIGFQAQSGIEPVILRLSDYGYGAYAQVICAHADLLATEPEAVKQFLAATFRGWQATLADIPKAAEMVVKHYVAPDSPYADLDYQTRSLTQIADYMLLGMESTRLGMINPDRWMRTAQQFTNYAIIETAPALEESLAAGFWPLT